MPDDDVQHPGTVTVIYIPRHEGQAPKPTERFSTVQYQSYRRFPDRERRKRPVGDVFDTATPRTTRSAWRSSSSAASYEKGPDYIVLTQGPASWWLGNQPTLDLDLEKSTSVWGELSLKTRGKIKNQRVNLMQALGERKQTARLLSDLAVDLVRVGKSLARTGGAEVLVTASDAILGRSRRKTRIPWSKSSKRAAQRWLQIQYGIRPAMNDIYGSASAVAIQAQRGLYHYDVQRRVVAEHRNTFGGSVGENVSTVRTYKQRTRWKYDMGLVPELSSLGLLNPAALVWELTPWSFVADWVLNMGEFLNGLDALAGTHSVKALQSLMIESRGLAYIQGDANGSQGAVGKATRRFGITGELGYGSPTFENPFAKNAVIRSLNGLALMRGQIRR